MPQTVYVCRVEAGIAPAGCGAKRGHAPPAPEPLPEPDVTSIQRGLAYLEMGAMMKLVADVQAYLVAFKPFYLGERRLFRDLRALAATDSRLYAVETWLGVALGPPPSPTVLEAPVPLWFDPHEGARLAGRVAAPPPDALSGLADIALVVAPERCPTSATVARVWGGAAGLVGEDPPAQGGASPEAIVALGAAAPAAPVAPAAIIAPGPTDPDAVPAPVFAPAFRGRGVKPLRREVAADEEPLLPPVR